MKAAPRPASAAARRAAPPGGVASALAGRFRGQALVWLVPLIAVAIWMIQRDVVQVRWAVELTHQGSSAPSVDATSASGYKDGQRHFLGVFERGETYRWIAAAQAWRAHGTLPELYEQDNAPEGRHLLLPRFYILWLHALASMVEHATGVPGGQAVELMAGWEPLVTHAVFFLAATVFAWARFGGVAALMVGAVVGLFPPVAAQFIPGVLTARTWALLLAVSGVVPALASAKLGLPGRCAAALLLGTSLSLDPSFGFPAILIHAFVAGLNSGPRMRSRDVLVPSLVGAGWSLLAWALDGAIWNTAVGELRFVHPLYALAWMGLALQVVALHLWRGDYSPQRRRSVTCAAAGALLLTPLLYSQAKHGIAGWLHASAPMRRLTSLDEGAVHAHLFAWLSKAPVIETVLACALPVAAALTLAYVRRRNSGITAARGSYAAPGCALAAAVVLSVLSVRWMVPASVIGIAVIAVATAPLARGLRWPLQVTIAAFCVLAAAGSSLLPGSLHNRREARPADIEALINRHFAHWLSNRSAGEPLVALAPPDLSDSLAFHGNVRVLLSSAWQSYPGHVAASRILSAPEWSEAQAVLESRQVTHLILPSWDRVLPLLVQPPADGRDTAFARLQRWVLPLYLRPLPYHFPPAPGYEDQKLPVFQVIAPQDEVLVLSRLAEYFAEMNRPEPAELVAQSLAETFPDEPNAAIARAAVAAHAGNTDAFARELTRVAAPLTDSVVLGWDRRVQRAIVLALGRRPQLARSELEECSAQATREDILGLTPLQAHRLRVLMERLSLRFADPELMRLLLRQGAEYAKAPQAPRS